MLSTLVLVIFIFFPTNETGGTPGTPPPKTILLGSFAFCCCSPLTFLSPFLTFIPFIVEVVLAPVKSFLFVKVVEVVKEEEEEE